jgi:peroxiredoxin Q/BCP
MMTTCQLRYYAQVRHHRRIASTPSSSLDRQGVTMRTTFIDTAFSRLALACLSLALALGTATTQAASTPAIGAPAPEFKLQDQTGAWRSLSDYRGKWVVLYFYPKDNTPGCTTQACELRDDIFAFRRANAAILGVSVDEVSSKENFAKEHSLPYPVLSDPNTEVTKAYGSLTSYPQFKLFNIARRDTFIIDPEGRIAKRYDNVDPKGHSAMVLAELKKLQR